MIHPKPETFNHFGDTRRVFALLPNGDHMTADGVSGASAKALLVVPLRAYQRATAGKTIVTVHLCGRRTRQRRYFFVSEVEERGAVIADDDGRLFIAFSGAVLRKFARPTWHRQYNTAEVAR